MIIKVSLFTSGRHTKTLIEALQKAPNIRLANIYKKLTDLSAEALRIRRAKADVFLVADFGQIIPPEILPIPKYGCLCIHPSLLPKYRGASPVPAVILAGDQETGVTIFLMDEKIDHGPIIAQFKEKMSEKDSAETLCSRLFAAGAKVLLSILPAWIEGRIKPREQAHHQATYTYILKREDGKISWKDLAEAIKTGGQKAIEIERKIRAFSPWPGVWNEARFKVQSSKFKVRRLKLLQAHLKITLNTQRVTTKQPKLILDKVQLEGKNPVSWKQFQEGYPNLQLNHY
jgi:methionyl-tRNA formyltransferase